MHAQYYNLTDMAQTNVTLTSSLYEGNIAYDTQNVTFQCITHGNGTILSWKSDDYIGSGGAMFEFISIDDPGSTTMIHTKPTTTAILISTTTEFDANTGVRVSEIVSELRIMASLQYPISSVSCQVNGNGPLNSTMFRTVPGK